MRHWLKGISNFYLNIWSQFCGPLTLCPLTNSLNQSLYQDAVSHLDRCDITCLLPEMILPSSRSPDVVPSLHKSYPVHNTRPYFIVIFFNFSYLLYGIKYLFYLLLSNYLFITQIQQYLLMPKCKSILVSCKETQSHFLCSKSHHLCVRWFLFSVTSFSPDLIRLRVYSDTNFWATDQQENWVFWEIFLILIVILRYPPGCIMIYITLQLLISRYPTNYCCLVRILWDWRLSKLHIRFSSYHTVNTFRVHYK